MNGPYILLAYAILMILGGLMGFRAGSKASLYAGVGSGVALLVAWGVTFVALGPGLWVGCALAALLAVTFAKRVLATGKFMPSGMLLLLSVAAAVLLAWQAYVSG